MNKRPYFLIFLCLLGIKDIHTQESPFSPVNKLDQIKHLIKTIEQDDSNTSFTTMIDDTVMKQYCLAYHKPHLPYFYTNNRMIISTILTMVVERPDGVIHTAPGANIVGIYRDFNFDRDLKSHFSKEKTGEGQFDGLHLGATEEGPTNRVAIFIKAENLPNSSTTKSASLKRSFLTAYPLSFK